MIFTALAVTAGALPAQASEPPYLQFYKWLPCAAGTSTTGQIDAVSAYGNDGWYIARVSGSLLTCRPPGTGHVFGLAGYRGSQAYGEPVQYVPNRPQPYTFTSPVRIYPDVHAVCLISNETTRLACVSIGWVPVNGDVQPVVGGPLAVDSPLVAAPAETDLMVNGPGGPGCGLCGG